MSNKLNCLTYGYLPLTYWKNWFRNIGQFFRNIKYAYQRITKGYCDYDVWDLEAFYSELFYQTLNKLADNLNGMPAKYALEDKSFEWWQSQIKEMSQHFQNTQEWNEDLWVNVYRTEAFDNMYSFVKEVKLDNGKLIKKYTNKTDYDEAKELWLRVEKIAADYRESEKNKAFDMMKDMFFDLWD